MASTVAPARCMFSIVCRADGRHVEPHVLLRLGHLHHRERRPPGTARPARAMHWSVPSIASTASTARSLTATLWPMSSRPISLARSQPNRDVASSRPRVGRRRVSTPCAHEQLRAQSRGRTRQSMPSRSNSAISAEQERVVLVVAGRCGEPEPRACAQSGSKPQPPPRLEERCACGTCRPSSTGPPRRGGTCGSTQPERQPLEPVELGAHSAERRVGHAGDADADDRQRRARGPSRRTASGNRPAPASSPTGSAGRSRRAPADQRRSAASSRCSTGPSACSRAFRQLGQHRMIASLVRAWPGSRAP